MKRKFLMPFVFLCLLFLRMGVYAQESIYTENILVETTEEVKLYQEPDASSAEVVTLEAHTAVFTAEKQQGDWIKVKKGNTEGYLQVSKIALFQAEGIRQEFEGKGNDYDLIFSEIAYNRNDRMQKIIWGITIVVLVISIFVVSIVSAALKEEKAIRKKRKGKVKGKNDETDDTDTLL